MPDKMKVFWSKTERVSLARRAADLTVDHPELNGLPLLRAAMEVLPPDRHRPLIALSQALWFRDMVQEEVQRRHMEDRLSTDAAAAVREQIARMETWSDEQLARLDKIIPAIERMGDESRLAETASRLDRLDRLETMHEHQSEMKGIIRDAHQSHQESRAHYMELAATVVLLLKSLIGEVQTLNERVGPQARPTVQCNAPAVPCPCARRTRDPETGDSTQQT